MMKSYIIMIEILAVMFFYSCENDSCKSVSYEASTKLLKSTVSDPFYCPQMENYYNIDSKQAVGDWMGKTYVLTLTMDSYNKITEKPAELPDTFTIGTLKECFISKSASNANCLDMLKLSFSVTDDKGFLTGCSLSANTYGDNTELYLEWCYGVNGEGLSNMSTLPTDDLTLDYYPEPHVLGYHLNYSLVKTTPKNFEAVPQ